VFGTINAATAYIIIRDIKAKQIIPRRIDLLDVSACNLIS